MLKLIIAILLVLMVASLFTGLGFLFKDASKSGSKRAFYALGVRVGLAISILSLTLYGFYSGQLYLKAPWHSTLNSELQNIDEEK